MKRLVFVLSLLLCIGCTKEVDFDQIDELDIRSEYIASLAYFDLFASDFLDEDLNEVLQIEDVVMPQLNADNAENVLQLDFTFQISNSFSRDFIASVFFYDENGAVLYQLDAAIEVNANTQDVQTVISVFPPNIEAVFNAHTAGFQLQLVPDASNPLLPDTVGVFGLKSSLKMYLSIKQ